MLCGRRREGMTQLSSTFVIASFSIGFAAAQVVPYNVLVGTSSADKSGCSELCTPLAGTRLQSICQATCTAVEAQSNTPCGSALLGSSLEHLSLLSYSSGHVAETVAILQGATSGKPEDTPFLSELHLNDRGSPDGCAAIEDAHYCLGQSSIVFSLGLCLPRDCESASVVALLSNITALVGGDGWETGISSSVGNDDDASAIAAAAFLGSMSFSCGDELRVHVDAGTSAVFSLAGVLVALVLLGTAVDYRRRRLYAYHKKQQQGTNPCTASRTPGDNDNDDTQGDSSLLWKSSRMGDVEGREPPPEQQQQQQQEEGTPSGLHAAGRGTGMGYVPPHSGDPGREPLLRKQPATSVLPEGRSSCVHDNASQQLPTGSDERSQGSFIGGNRGRASQDQQEVACWIESLECFSLIKNMDRLLAPPRAGNEFAALDGVRTLSMLWVVLGHTLLVALIGAGFTNTIELVPQDGKGLLARLSGQVIPAGFLAVDTFFFMSGFLLSTVLLPKLDAGKLGKCAWVAKAYLHRYLRLTPTLAFVTLVYWKVLPLVGEGPAWWPVAIRQADACRRYWWAEILYVTNVIPWPPISGGCIGVSWYLSNDTMFFVAGVPLVALYHRRPRAGVAVALSILAASCGYTLIFAFREDVRFSLFHAVDGEGWLEIYGSPWTRCPVYLIGLLFGFAWHAEFRCDRAGGNARLVSFQDGDGSSSNTPGDDRRSQGVERDNFLERHRKAPVVPIMAVVSACLLALPAFGSYWAYQDSVESTIPAWLDHLYIVFARPAWALGLALMCALCFSGRGGFVNWLLTRPGWTTPSRLTYCSYLMHPVLLLWLYGSQPVASSFTSVGFAVTYMGVAVGTLAGATALHLLVEAPFRNLESWARREPRRRGVGLW